MAQISLSRILLLCAAGGIVAFLARPDLSKGNQNGVELTARKATRAGVAVAREGAGGRPSVTVQQLGQPSREPMPSSTASNLFAPMSWLPPPPPPPPAPEKLVAEPPQAPPLPYRYVGMLQDSAKPSAFLAHGDLLLIVSAGDTLEGQYRVDTLTAHDIGMTYLPLNQQQHIRLTGE